MTHYSPRQWDIIKLVAEEDLTYDEVATTLGIHVSTVRVHVERIVERSGFDLKARKAIHRAYTLARSPD